MISLGKYLPQTIKNLFYFATLWQKRCSASSLFRKLIGSFLIGVFTFSVTPVAFLHDWVANHTDVCYHNFKEKGKQVSKADINCKCFDFVAEARFLNPVHTFFFPVPAIIPVSRNSFHLLPFYSPHHFFAGLRGPPRFS